MGGMQQHLTEASHTAEEEIEVLLNLFWLLDAQSDIKKPSTLP